MSTAEPLSFAARVDAYRAQTGRSRLTGAQSRRVRQAHADPWASIPSVQSGDCPAWCDRSHLGLPHAPQLHHGRVAEADEGGTLVLVDVSGYRHQPRISVHADGAPLVVLQMAQDAEGLATLFERLGHPAAAAAIRTGITAMSGGAA